MNTMARNITIIAVFSVAMAALEGAVVVYLRALYYPDGFSVAFKLIDQQILIVEIIREAATLIMIAAVAGLAGKSRHERVAYFLLSFAIWDIFYYAWLKLFIDWPLSFFDWDILFLIPFVWLGPVLSPIIVSLTMILLAGALLIQPHPVRIARSSLWFLVGGVLLILYTYLFDYGVLLFNNDLLSGIGQLFQNEKFLALARKYQPGHYQWTVFWLGEVLLCIGTLKIFLKSAGPVKA